MRIEVSCKECGILTGPYSIGQDDAITVDRCVCAEIEIEKLQAEIARLKEANRWIPVAEGWPDWADGIQVIQDGRCRMACCRHDGFYIGRKLLAGVTHFRLTILPEQALTERSE